MSEGQGFKFQLILGILSRDSMVEPTPKSQYTFLFGDSTKFYSAGSYLINDFRLVSVEPLVLQ